MSSSCVKSIIVIDENGMKNVHIPTHNWMRTSKRKLYVVAHCRKCFNFHLIQTHFMIRTTDSIVQTGLYSQINYKVIKLFKVAPTADDLTERRERDRDWIERSRNGY